MGIVFSSSRQGLLDLAIDYGTAGQDHLYLALQFTVHPWLGYLRLTIRFVGRTIGQQDGCSAPEAGGHAEKVDYELSTY